MKRVTPIFIVLVVLIGCRTKLKDSRILDVAPADLVSVYVDAPKYDQKVTVEFSSSNGPVSVCVCVSSNERKVIASLDISTNNKMVLGSAQEAATGTIEVTVPANQEFAVLVFGLSKPTKVALKINGK